ncbi:MAG TPA: formylglycine-generating enzyme family protein [Terriglobia bacterium]|nr:formylglycine-generating enzyme family protein [Terriglobia bacterium]
MTTPIRRIGLATIGVAAVIALSTGLSAARQQTAAPAAAARPAAAPLTPVKVEYVKIPAGEFMMGCSKGDTTCDMHDQGSPLKDLFKDLSETPVHAVKITKPFEMGKYVVLQAEWQTIMGSNPSTFQGANYPVGNFPVENISWSQIQDFLTKINATNDGFKYRLPTEAEWEYAARAGTAGAIPGDSLEAIAWYDQKGGPHTHAVGTKAANAWGLYDMMGNVWQWVQDGYSDYKKNPVSDPLNNKGDKRVLRGGSWDLSALEMRVSNRFAIPPNFKNNSAGFRLVREPK